MKKFLLLLKLTAIIFVSILLFGFGIWGLVNLLHFSSQAFGFWPTFLVFLASASGGAAYTILRTDDSLVSKK